MARLVKKKVNASGVVEDIDKRGKHGKQFRIGEEVIEDFKTFVAKLPKYTSHYGRGKRDGSLLTLAPGLTKAKLYKEFLAEKTYTVSQEWFNKF